MTTRRIATMIAAGMMSLAMLTGCSQNGGAGDEQSTAAGTPTRTVTDATGAEVEVPAEPTKVATLHYAATQALQDLGVAPAGQGQFQENFVPADRVEELNGIPVVADQEPDLEKLAEVDPDLILVPNIYEPDMISQLAELAPVYQFTLRGDDRANWNQRVEEIADAVNRTEALDELDETFTAEQKRVADASADVAPGTTVGVVSSFKENTAYLWGSENMVGSLFLPLGVDWSADANAMIEKHAKATQGGNRSGEPEPEAEISMEVLGQALADADIIFVTSDLRGGYDAATQTMMDSPVFKELPAVKAGHVYPHGKATIAGYADAMYDIEMAEKALEDYRNS